MQEGFRPLRFLPGDGGGGEILEFAWAFVEPFGLGDKVEMIFPCPLEPPFMVKQVTPTVQEDGDRLRAGEEQRFSATGKHQDPKDGFNTQTPIMSIGVKLTHFRHSLV